MIKKFFAKRKLVALISRLATYNDKGISWGNHSDLQVAAERERLTNLIEVQLAKLSDSDETKSIAQALNSGFLYSDITGQYVSVAKSIRL